MSYTVKFCQPEKELPQWLKDYEPERPSAPVDLHDLQMLTARIAREHPIVSCWASNSGGELHIKIAGRGKRCRHYVEVAAKDSFGDIISRVNAEVVRHVDECCGRATGRPQQLNLRLFA